MRGGNGAEEPAVDEYGSTTSLSQILEELMLHCNINGVANAKISIKLPKIILDKYAKDFGATNGAVIKKLNLNGGTIEFDAS